jgi:PKD repeat protein
MPSFPKMRGGGPGSSSIWRAFGAVGLLVCVATVLALVTAGGAFAAETIVSFDTLTAGVEVTNQYEAEGLKLGFAGEFGQSSPEREKQGNCGPPTAESEAKSGVAAASSPNYAILPECVSAGPEFEGSYGALLGHPRGAISVEVSNLQSSAPIEVQLVAYDSEGHEVTSADGEAESGVWRRISVKAEPKISYFMVRTVKAVINPKIGIDNLSFEVPNEGGGGGGGSTTTTTTTTPPPGPVPPTATVTLQTPNPASGQLLSLSGATSQPGSGHIISYDWDLNGDGKVDTSTGTNPVAHVILAPGVHTVGLTVTNSNGESSTTKFGLTLPTVNSVIHPPDGGEGPCEPTLELGESQLIAECIQTLPGGGYAIATKQLALNGMVFEPQGGGIGVFKIVLKSNFASLTGGKRALLSGPTVNVALLNTPIGDVVLGSRNLEAEPVQLAILGGGPPPTIPFYHGLHRARAHAADEETKPKTLLFAMGVGRECGPGEGKKAGCCPKGENVSCATLPGGFPLVGQVAIYLSGKGGLLIDAQVGLELKGIFEATGAIEIAANAQTGISLNSLKFTIPEAGLEGIFTVKKASFVYYFPSAPEESKRDTWQAQGEIVFGPLGEPALEAELAFKKGQFHSGSLVFTSPPPGIPIYPGIFLNKLGGSIGSEPFSFGGVLGAKVATQLELTLSFKYREATSQELGFFGGQGQLELDDDKIATLAADVYSDGYVDAQLNIDLHIPFSSENPVVRVGGTIGFWDEPASGLWQAEGSVYLKIWVISAEVAGLVNNQYIAGCLGVDGFGLQGRYRFSDGSISGGGYAFSNCSDQLKQYKQTPLVKHSGGFVESESLLRPYAAKRRASAFDFAAGSAATAFSALTGEADSFTLPAGQFAQALRLTSSSGTPVVTLTAPGGQTYTTPTAPGQIVASSQFLGVVSPDPDQVLVMLKHPQGGTWRVQSAPGSPPLEKLEVAGDTPPATVKVRVTHGHGSRWSLAYRIGNFVPGSGVRFVERGRDSTHVLGTVHRASGTLQFVPQDGLSRARSIDAYLLGPEEAPVRELTVGRYTAPAAARPGRPGRVKIVRKGLTAIVSWGAAAGARGYEVRVRGSDGRLETRSTTGAHRSLVIPNVLPFESFTVVVTPRGGPDLLSGSPALGRLAVLAPPRTGSPRKKAGKRSR